MICSHDREHSWAKPYAFGEQLNVALGNYLGPLSHVVLSISIMGDLQLNRWIEYWSGLRQWDLNGMADRMNQVTIAARSGNYLFLLTISRCSPSLVTSPEVNRWYNRQFTSGLVTRLLLSPSRLHLPITCTDTLQLGLNMISPTQEDVHKLNEHKVVKFISKSTWEWQSEIQDYDKLSPAALSILTLSVWWDDDCNHLTDCNSIFTPVSLKHMQTTPLVFSVAFGKTGCWYVALMSSTFLCNLMIMYFLVPWQWPLWKHPPNILDAPDG